eukprot:1334985-Pleurochrysis_carterae.AAC.1
MGSPLEVDTLTNSSSRSQSAVGQGVPIGIPWPDAVSLSCCRESELCLCELVAGAYSIPLGAAYGFEIAGCRILEMR